MNGKKKCDSRTQWEDFRTSLTFDYLRDQHVYGDERFIETFMTSAREFVACIQDGDYNTLSLLQKPVLDREQTEIVIRSIERHQNTVRILQYLLTFFSELPFEQHPPSEQSNPFVQFKSFVEFNVDQLIHRDVVNAIMRYQQVQKDDVEDIRMYHKWRVYKHFNEIRDILRSAKQPVAGDWQKLFIVLEKFCLFWFSLKNEEMQYIRGRDLVMFMLTRILIHKIDAHPWPGPARDKSNQNH